MQIWIGTSGYSYPDWVGPFYPPGTRPGRMLVHYCRHFPLVELNFSFYRLPTPAMLARMAEQTPAGFQFILKLPRTLSHEADSRDLPAFRQAAEELRQRGRLQALLCQLPQAAHHEPRHRAWLETLAAELVGFRLAVEFRHRSWADAEVPAWLAAHDLDLVSVDVPDLPGLYPRGLVPTGRRAYVRFHSRNAANWYRSDKDRYDYDYEDDALTEWVHALRTAGPGEGGVLMLFNNCQRSQAAANAGRMRDLLRQMVPEFEVVAPFAAPVDEAQQRLLFD
jgi:uncharacterized protein YecE (DUF72 family)